MDSIVSTVLAWRAATGTKRKEMSLPLQVPAPASDAEDGSENLEAVVAEWHDGHKHAVPGLSARDLVSMTRSARGSCEYPC